MYDPAQALKDLLVTAGEGVFPPSSATSSQWGIAVAREPASPDRVITVYTTGGQSPNPRWLINYPMMQVRIRGEQGGYQDTYDKADAVVRALTGLNPVTLGPNNDRWDALYPLGDVNILQYDQLDRPLLTVNFRAIVEPAQVAGDTRLPL